MSTFLYFTGSNDQIRAEKLFRDTEERMIAFFGENATISYKSTRTDWILTMYDIYVPDEKYKVDLRITSNWKTTYDEDIRIASISYDYDGIRKEMLFAVPIYREDSIGFLGIRDCEG